MLKVLAIRSYTHVDDVVLGMWLAVERGRIGEEYILAGSPLILEQLYCIVANQMGISLSRLRISP